MEWTRLEVNGRVTAMRRGLCAGVDAESRAFVCYLGPLHEKPIALDGVVLDSFGVIGASPGDEAWLTGRGADGRLHLFGAHPERADTDGEFLEHSLERVGAMWAAPVLDSRAALVLTSSLHEGTWRLRVYDLTEAIGPGKLRARELVLGGEPDTSVDFSFHEKGPLLLAGRIGEGTHVGPAAWTLTDIVGPAGSDAHDWRRVHLAPAPTELSSAAVGWVARRAWVAGRVDARPVVWEVLSLPFRGLVRSTPVPMPRLELSPAVLEPGGGRPVVLVEESRGDLPAFVAATVKGNRLCWHDGTEWKAFPAPDGRLRAACRYLHAVHVLVDDAVWSLPDPAEH